MITTMPSVFMDDSGKLVDANQRVVVLSALVATEPQIAEIDETLEVLRRRVCEDKAITQLNRRQDFEAPTFEFHATDIYQGERLWQGVPCELRILVLRRLRKTILDLRLPLVVILADKDKGATYGFQALSQYISPLKDFANLRLAENPCAKQDWEAYAKQMPQKGVGDFDALIALLLGVTSAFLDLEGFKGNARVVPDDDLFKAVPAWQDILDCVEKHWPDSAQRYQIPGWPRDFKLSGWHLDPQVIPQKSHQNHGVQLADYLAYTTGRYWRLPNELPKNTYVLRDADFRQFLSYRGIWVALSGPVANAKLSPATKQVTKPWLRRYGWR